MNYLKEAWLAQVDSWGWFIEAMLTPSWNNYFYWLIGVSMVILMLETLAPWRKEQRFFRKDFWLDTFYMFFNYFLFYQIGYWAMIHLSNLLIDNGTSYIGIKSFALFDLSGLGQILPLFILFVVVDFTHWNVHRLLHRVPWLWEFHKVHHSVEEMGVAAHLRYHWMENVVYRSLQYFPIAIIGGFELEQVFFVHMAQMIIGHLNHANLPLSYGPLKYILNNPKMHIWHHAHELPPQSKYGCNYGISLSLWDYIFGTVYLPKSGRDIKLGFEGLKSFPRGFIGQFVYPFKTKKEKTKPE